MSYSSSSNEKISCTLLQEIVPSFPSCFSSVRLSARSAATRQAALPPAQAPPPAPLPAGPASPPAPLPGASASPLHGDSPCLCASSTPPSSSASAPQSTLLNIFMLCVTGTL